MLPLSLLKTAQNHPMLVEWKNGETYNGHLVSCDNWMNINLREGCLVGVAGDARWRWARRSDGPTGQEARPAAGGHEEPAALETRTPPHTTTTTTTHHPQQHHHHPYHQLGGSYKQRAPGNSLLHVTLRPISG
ncbi:hypothetical protein CRUP_023947 [Coryphaenoides rupestris]|nr:hypothetical protein CRUP_023947 [Coryphaenoides rupestris]